MTIECSNTVFAKNTEQIKCDVVFEGSLKSSGKPTVPVKQKIDSIPQSSVNVCVNFFLIQLLQKV